MVAEDTKDTNYWVTKKILYKTLAANMNCMSDVEPVCLMKIFFNQYSQTGADVPLLSGRLDWTQSNANHWKPSKYVRDNIQKIIILLGYTNNAAISLMKS